MALAVPYELVKEWALAPECALSHREEFTSAAGSRIDWAYLTARVKLVLFPISRKAELFSLLIIELKNFLDGSLVRLERVAIARDGIRNVLEKVERIIHILVAMKRNETARK